MPHQTQVQAGEGNQDIQVFREFQLPVELLYTAHTDPEIFGEWMGSKVILLEAMPNGRWQVEKRDEQGQLLFGSRGVFHDIIPNQKIIRTFEMANATFDAQLEFLEFEALTETTSRLRMQIIFRNGALRDQMLKLPFAYGLSMAHDRLESIVRLKFNV